MEEECTLVTMTVLIHSPFLLPVAPRYIQSLSRCFTWMARGGKSGSSFCKTQDDRFILKQMSRYEVQSFAEFAPHYFHYITQAHADKVSINLIYWFVLQP